MRVIAGAFRSRPLKSVPGLSVRPTPDRLREALFNVLAHRIAGAAFIDAYAGSGAVGIEAVSRGANHVILIERNPQALAVIRENLKTLAIESSVTVVRGKASLLLPSYGADIVFLDPPYDQVKEYTDSLLAISQTNCRLAVAQHASRLTLEPQYGRLHKTRVLRQGDNSLSFYEASDEHPSHSSPSDPS
jgi:16S rRNA (guanine(966)-N(2))-methyltransferase RsmD